EQSMHCKVGCVSIAEIEAGPEALQQAISNKPENVVVCDVMEASHLSVIARAAALAGGQWLLCGSGGLARELHLLLADAPKYEKMQSRKQAVGPALVVVGTRNQVAASQLLKAHDQLGILVLNLEAEKLNKEGILSGRPESVLKEADTLIGEGKGIAISSTFSRYVPALKQSMAGIMAEIVAGILASHQFAGLFLSGGDIAVEVCRRLQVSAIQVHGEVEPGVPAGELIGGQHPGMRVVTKAGGFGTEEAMVKSIHYLERGNVS
ncbi:MAG TPA: nucleotide-binding domain containing protein, partial [Dehalococcoidales bacterium]|nr:nucleotide-binding domain containing protein [Dehalococcoidales bacterium]